jgi:putative transposase
MPETWRTFCDQLYISGKIFDLEVHSFVLMGNHFHLLVTAPKLNLSQAMAYFLRESSRQILKDNQRINRTFSARFFRSRIVGFHHYMTVYKYIYRNPVEAGIADCPEAYRFSTLHSLLGFSRLEIPLLYDPLLDSEEVETTLKWLNQTPSPENKLAVQKALRRPEFRLPNHKKQPHPLNEILY